MMISLDWLSDFVDLAGLDPEEIAERLTVHTAEVEGWERLERTGPGVVVGRIEAVERLPSDSAAVVLATVDVGARRVETVCGAPNAFRGATVAVALPGTRLSGGAVVTEAEVHGKRSTAVLCSPAELGWSSAHEGLLLLPDGLAPGTPLETLVPPQDVLIEIDNKSLTHRPDLWGHYGFARELSAIFGRPLRPYETVELNRFDHLPPVDVRIDDPEDCPYYAAMRIEAEGNPPSPPRMQSRLHAIGSRSRNLLVDVTNYVQFELGQPTHAFDGDKVRSIRVARSGVAQEMRTLDGKPWPILPEDLLIHEGKRPIAIAGIMGGLESEVSPGTRVLLLESANFRAARIRQTSVRLGLRTDASLRFEKKLPPIYARSAIGRILTLFAQAGYKHRPVSRLSSAGDLRDRHRRIHLPAGDITRRAGTEIPDDTAAAILTAIGFECRRAPDGGLDVSVPPFRGEFDIAIPEDLAEEVMRLYGYDRIPPQLPPAPVRSTPPHLESLNHHRARRVLAQGHGFVEVQSYCWFADEWLREIGYEPPRPTLNIRNPLAVDRRRLRETLLPNLLAFVLQNRRVADRFRLFELGPVFWRDASGGKQEAPQLAGVAVDQTSGVAPEAEFRGVRAAIEDLATAAGLPPLTFRRGAAAGAPWRGTSATLDILREDRLVGAMGLLPSVLRRKVLDAGHAVWFWLEIDALAGPLFPASRYQPPPVFPGSWQDFTFVWKTAAGYQDLTAVLSGYHHPALTGVEFVTVYTPKGQETSRYTFRFHLGWPDRTISTEDIQSFREGFLAYAGRQGLTIA